MIRRPVAQLINTLQTLEGGGFPVRRMRHETKNYRMLTQLIGRGGQLKEFFP